MPNQRVSAPAPLQMSVGLLYSTTTGNTETVAGYITAACGVEAEDIGDVEDDALMAHDALICGAPTWHTGADEQRSGTAWDEFLFAPASRGRDTFRETSTASRRLSRDLDRLERSSPTHPQLRPPPEPRPHRQEGRHLRPRRPGRLRASSAVTMSERSTDCRALADSDNFCDAAGELFAPASRDRDYFRDICSFRYDCLTAQGATVVGMTSQDGYDHTDSKAVRDGMFCGLLCDEDNEYDKSEERATAWVEQLKSEGVAF